MSFYSGAGLGLTLWTYLLDRPGMPTAESSGVEKLFLKVGWVGGC